MPRIPPSIRAIAFDAVDTLLHPQPSVVDVYHACGAGHGYDVSLPEVSRRFRQAMARACWHPATEEHHHAQWQAIVQSVFADDSPRLEPLLADLWRHFAQSSAWRLFDDVPPAVRALVQRGYRLVVASNGDRRLREICESMAELRCFAAVYCATELGYAKPAAAFFETIAARLQLAPEQLLMIGDDYEADIASARRCGWHAWHLQREVKGAELSSLDQLAEGTG